MAYAQMQGRCIQPVHRDPLDKITKYQLCDLVASAETTEVSGLIFEELRGILKFNLENLIRDVITHTDQARRKTLLAQDVLGGLVYGQGALNRPAIAKTVSMAQYLPQVAAVGLARTVLVNGKDNR